jgi:putative membrane protein
MKAIHLLTAAMAAALVACSPAGEEPAVEETPDLDLAVPSPSQIFVDMVASSDQFEIEAGRLAQELGTSQEVKDFGTMMVEDHLMSTANLRTALEPVTPPLPVNSILTPEQEQLLQQFRDAGEGFDALYAEQMVSKHEERLAKLRDYAANGEIAELKTFATTGAETTATHLEHARELP